MIKPADKSFNFETTGALCAEISRLKLGIPVSENFSILSRKLKIGGKTISNRLSVLPMEGADALPGGSPGALTFRRYTRFAHGGFGLIWVEATAFIAEARSNSSQLYLNRQNLTGFAGLVSAMRSAARKRWGHNIIIILQLTHPGRYCRPDGIVAPFITHHNPVTDRIHGIPANYPVVTDDYLDRLQDRFIEAAQLASEAGFDGVDVKACHNNLIAELLGSRTRKGKYGGSFENRSRFLVETVKRMKKDFPRMLIASRISAYNALRYPYGFGVDRDNFRKPDPVEPVKLAKLLEQAGLSILNVSVDNPAAGTAGRRGREEGPFDVITDSMSVPGEQPLVGIDRIMRITGRIQKAVPGLPVAGRGFSWFRQFAPEVAAGAVENGVVAIAGFGRGALAYPGLAGDLMNIGRLDPEKCCMACSACMQIIRDGGRAGCVIRDSGVYGVEYRRGRQFAPDSLRAEALRCHNCKSATCTAGCPAHIDVPGFIRAYAEDDIGKAFGIIRRSNVLPEMCSNLCPAWLMCEGACIESSLSGNPIRIKDLQYAVCWTARNRGLTGTEIPGKSSGKFVAIVGAGPAGSACAIKLLEAGHNVVILECRNETGGTPQHVIRSGRISGVREEVDTALGRGIQAGRLVVRYGQELGKNISLRELTKDYDAVLIATGLWKEQPLGKAEGVVDALTFLEKVKKGRIESVPARVAILAGGDSAMDVSVTAGDLGATDLYLVYPGSLSDMHWHMDAGWFRDSGANMLSLTRPKGYEVDKNGRLTGLKICRTEYAVPDKSGTRRIRDVPGTNGVIKVDLVVEAKGLGLTDGLKKALKGVRFTKPGLIKTVGAGSFATGLRKVFVAGGLINGGASVVQCIVEGMNAAEEIGSFLRHKPAASRSGGL